MLLDVFQSSVLTSTEDWRVRVVTNTTVELYQRCIHAAHYVHIATSLIRNTVAEKSRDAPYYRRRQWGYVVPGVWLSAC